MTPDQLLTHHTSSPRTTPNLLSRLPQAVLTSLLSSVSTRPSLLEPLFTHPPLRATILSNGPINHLTPFLQTLPQALSTGTQLHTLSTTATTLLRSRRYTLLIPLLQALTTIPGPSARAVFRDIVQVFLSLAGDAPTLDIQTLQSFLELPYDPADHIHIVSFVDRTIPQFPVSSHPALLTTLLTSPLPLARPLLALLSRAGRDTLIALQATLHDGHAPRLAYILTRALLTKAVPLTPSLSNSLFLLLAHGDDNTSSRVRLLFNKILRGVVSTAAPVEGGSGTTVESVLQHAIRTLPSGCELVVSDLLEGLLWTSHRAKAASLVDELFLWHDCTRNRILRGVLSALSARCSSVAHACFRDLFKRLLTNPCTVIAARSCAGVLADALDDVFRMPHGTDACVVQLLAGLLVCSSARDRVMIFLRKVCGARGWRERRAGCSGLLAVLAVDAGEEIHADVCEILVILVRSDAAAFVTGLLLEAIERRRIPLERVSKVVQAVTERCDVLRGVSDIARCFVQAGEDYVLRDPLPLMIRFCVTARGSALGPDLTRFLAYLCSEQGALCHACDARRSAVPSANQVSLICDLLETFIGLGFAGKEESTMKVYGMAILLRGLLASSGEVENRRKSNRLEKVENEYMSMRQVATANQLGSSAVEDRDGDLRSYLSLRINALSLVSELGSGEGHILANVVRAEIITHVETDLRAVLSRKEAFLTAKEVDVLVKVIHKFFQFSSPWFSQKQERSRDESQDPKNAGENVKEGDENVHDFDEITLLTRLDLDKGIQKAFEQSKLQKMGEHVRIRMRQSSLGALCVLLGRKLVNDDIAYIMSLTDGEPVANDTYENGSEANKQRNLLQESKSTLVPDDNTIVISRLCSLFRREFANSLSISLTLSYLDLLRHFVKKTSKQSDDTKKARKIVFESLTSLLKEYSIRNQTVMRNILKLLTNTLDAGEGVKFATSLLTWLGGTPCLLNSKFVQSDDRSNVRLGVNDFDRDILEEAIALDAGEESEEEETSDQLNRENTLRKPVREEETSNLDNQEGASGEALHGGVRGLVDDSRRDGARLESTPRMASDNGDPVTSLCLDETPEVALLSITSVLELLEHLLVAETQSYREALKGSKQPVLDTDLIAEQVCTTMKDFCNTSFMQSFGLKSQLMPVLLLRRLSPIVHALLEIAQLSFQLLLKMVRNEIPEKEMKGHLQSAQAILNILYEGGSSDAVISAALEGERRSSRTSLQEGVNVSAAELFRYLSGNENDLDDETRASISGLRKTLKSRKNRLPHVHSVNTPWTQSSGDGEHVPGEYFRVSQPQKRQRLRSRNPDIDDWLREEKDGDNYADLEDFLVAMDADEL